LIGRPFYFNQIKTVQKQVTGSKCGANGVYFVEWQGNIYLGWGNTTSYEEKFQSVRPFVTTQELSNWWDRYIIESTPERVEFLTTQNVEDNYAGLMCAMRAEKYAEDMIEFCVQAIILENTPI
jgi:hypothetical protein